MESQIAAEPQSSARVSVSIRAGNSAANTQSRKLTWWVLLLAVWMISGIYSAHLLKRGWWPFDEGTIGQCAERALQGELPHRDFKDPYTGALTYLNAFAFSIFGTNSASPRIVLFLVSMVFVPAVYVIASRFTSPVGAAGATLLSIAWSLPNYPAALPSWYNLFLATFGAMAALRFLETNQRKWIFLAGLCGGVSCLFKITGLYFIAAVCVTLLFREQCTTYDESDGSASRSYPIFLKAAFVAMTSVLFLMFRRNWFMIPFVQFVLPGTALVALCLRRDYMRSAIPSAARFRSLLHAIVPFIAGITLPIALFLIPYIRSGSLAEFFTGVFVLPLRRFDYTVWVEPLSVPQLLGCLISAIFLIAIMYLQRPLRWPLRWLLVAGLVLCLIAAPRSPQFYQLVWGPLRMMIPLCVFGGVLLLSSKRASLEISPLRQQQVVLLLALAAFCSLVQMPYAVAIYFCYVAPLLVLALAALLSAGKQRPGFLTGSVAAFYTAFAVLWFTPSYFIYMGRYYVPDQQIYPLTLARAGGLRVLPQQGKNYERLIRIVQEHANGSTYVYCAPDCPEVPFLSGLHNPTGTLFDFFENPAGHNRRTLEAIDSHEMKVVVIALDPIFSKPMSKDLQAALRQRFPEALRVGDFEVRWRD